MTNKTMKRFITTITIFYRNHFLTDSGDILLGATLNLKPLTQHTYLGISDGEKGGGGERGRERGGERGGERGRERWGERGV